MSRPLLASLLAALALAAIAPAASAQTPGAAADLAGRWTSDTRDERGMEIRTEGAGIAVVRRWRTDGTICTQTLSGTFDPARRSASLDQRSTCENGANGTGPACALRVTASDRFVLTCPDFNPRTFRRAAR
ncbi:MAG: hypothetical protein JNK84_20410 [Phreatobacter sp.]|uniref:hypothetical protein n=1 Tax=Phreatobacter sp. TaxID=1966341 RepID=UPI001A4E519B|nr:hypothetical protein [Phreatobacter sp.]MBL8571446.1 hypothetical protein [Phreatobacter sp.]